jgi:hypothetical protein
MSSVNRSFHHHQSCTLTRTPFIPEATASITRNGRVLSRKLSQYDIHNTHMCIKYHFLCHFAEFQKYFLENTSTFAYGSTISRLGVIGRDDEICRIDRHLHNDRSGGNARF